MKLTADQARRVAVAAQGFSQDRDKTVTMRQVRRVIDRLGQFQIDAVNVLARAHLMPLYSRLGPYDTALLTRAAEHAPRQLFEFWGHAASLIDVNLYPALQFRRQEAAHHAWGRVTTMLATRPQIIEEVAQAVAQHGPATARHLDLGEDKQRDHWGWNWSLAKTALEWLFWCGRVDVAGRTPQFERVYDLPERVIAAELLAACQPWSKVDAAEQAELAHQGHVELVRRAARALGVATSRCLADYFRTDRTRTRAAVDQLVAVGELIPVEVDTIREPTWLWHEVTVPRHASGTALISPFDSLVFERQRLARFFDTQYTIGLYTPRAQRTHGYYVYLFLLDGRFAARTDLKADRVDSVLRVQSAWLEQGCSNRRAAVVTELVSELRRMADWLRLTDITVADAGDLAHDLRLELARPRASA
ncbi:MAG: winged helix DNA-binding domain-containing protein [Propionibacteriaceae bacterium]|nr:winged helix DNA-binding domain-containing protein [Propionibacteriaceae bacterium]